MYRQTQITDEQLWELGYERQCIYADIYCRFEPCTIAHDIRCCGECKYKCLSSCKIWKKRGH